MAKITPVLWIHNENAEGRSPIYLRISAQGKTKYKTLGIRLKETHWNERLQRVRRSHKKREEINALIEKKLSEASDLVLDRKRAGEPVTARYIKAGLAEVGEEKKSGSVEGYFAFADGVIERLDRQGKIYTHKRYKSCIKKFRKWTGEPLPFDDITPELLRNYETHLIEHYGNKQTTVAANFAAIRAILYRAIRAGHAEQSENPFFHFKVKQGTPDRDKLMRGQLRAIEELDLEREGLIWHVRNYFLFATYVAGVRFGDIAKMQRRNVVGGRLVYQMSKTGTERSVKLLPPARKIADYYLGEHSGNGEARLFPILEGYDTSTPRKLVGAIGNQNALVNKYLKKIAERAQINAKVSFHVARHTFATIALQKGWDVAEISKMLGHGDLKTTQNYLKAFDHTDLDGKMDALFQ